MNLSSSQFGDNSSTRSLDLTINRGDVLLTGRIWGCVMTLLDHEPALLDLNAGSSIKKTMTLQLSPLWVVQLVSSNLGLSTFSARTSRRESASKEKTVQCNMPCLMMFQKKALLVSRREFISDFVQFSFLIWLTNWIFDLTLAISISCVSRH